MKKIIHYTKTLFTFPLLLLISNITFAQQDTLIKKQYTDVDNAATTVVVKNNSADDFDILANQFNDASIQEVIFIKTKNLTSAKPKSERTSFADIVKETKKPVAKVVALPISTSTSSTDSNTRTTRKVVNKKPSQTINKKPTATTKRRSSYYHKGGFINPKMKKKKIKKRRRVKKSRRNKCYQF